MYTYTVLNDRNVKSEGLTMETWLLVADFPTSFPSRLYFFLGCKSLLLAAFAKRGGTSDRSVNAALFISLVHTNVSYDSK